LPSPLDSDSAQSATLRHPPSRSWICGICRPLQRCPPPSPPRISATCSRALESTSRVTKKKLNGAGQPNLRRGAVVDGSRRSPTLDPIGPSSFDCEPSTVVLASCIDKLEPTQVAKTSKRVRFQLPDAETQAPKEVKLIALRPPQQPKFRACGPAIRMLRNRPQTAAIRS